jgi:hypothetical protein
MSTFIDGAYKQFMYYKTIAEKAMSQVEDDVLFLTTSDEANSIAIIVKHLSGNMRSRWTEFRSQDGEKRWRNRESEFENDIHTRVELMSTWDMGWNCFFEALKGIHEDELQDIIYVRNQGQTIMDAVLRQLAHYPYHIGQIIHICKAHSTHGWQSLSIPRGGSQSYNQAKFASEKEVKHFVDDYLENEKVK